MEKKRNELWTGWMNQMVRKRRARMRVKGSGVTCTCFRVRERRRKHSCSVAVWGRSWSLSRPSPAGRSGSTGVCDNPALRTWRSTRLIQTPGLDWTNPEIDRLAVWGLKCNRVDMVLSKHLDWSEKNRKLTYQTGVWIIESVVQSQPLNHLKHWRVVKIAGVSGDELIHSMFLCSVCICVCMCVCGGTYRERKRS